MAFRNAGILFAAGLCAALTSQAQLVEDFNPPRSACCLLSSARTLADQLQDWNQLGRYYPANEVLKKQPADPRRVVFMGDSITDFWNLEESFPGKPYVDRGISGQTTSQMLVRMYPDVIDLHPAAVVILAGTNDIARNTGPVTLTMIEENLMAMTDLAQKKGIKVVLCSVTPVNDYTTFGSNGGRGGRGGAPQTGPRIMTGQRPPADIVRLNTWMKNYAAQTGAVYADYYSAVVDDKGMMKDGLADDGLHPNAKGYALMSPVVEAAIQKALR